MRDSFYSQGRKGVVLVMVLVILVLFCGLVIAILFSSRTERQSSSLFADGLEARQLADTALNLCIGQVTDATTGGDRAWAVQPGLIRTYRGNRKPDVHYRLYSWGDMRPSGVFDPFADPNLVAPNWRGMAGLYVDLNEPLANPDAPTDPSRDKYPILYPPGATRNGTLAVEGYDVETVAGVNSISDLVPMPVQWLYVLRDGSVHPAVSFDDGQVQVAAATRDNPITGRIAFWADDESAKVNVNTAAGGKTWLPPFFETPKERTPGVPPYGFGFSQPVRNEFQRYPGHPATTDLRPVFPELGWDDLYRIVPRIVTGGSRNGTLNTHASAPVTPDTHRLFPTPSELEFQSAKPSATTERRLLSSSFQAAIEDDLWRHLLQTRKGFFTTFSRAPELNLFGKPRIAVWPMPERSDVVAGNPFRSALDKLIAFCATLENPTNAAYPFYFTRMTGNVSATPNSSLDESADITRARNLQLYQYLQRLTDDPFPGVSENAFTVSGKYGGAHGRDQVLTEMFDYIRTTNLEDMTLHQSRRFTDTGVVVPTRYNAGNGETRGFGRMLTVRQAGLHFIATADGSVPLSNRPPEEPAVPGGPPNPNLTLEPYPAGKLGASQRRIQAVLMLELFSPSAGNKMFYTGGGGTLRLQIRVLGLDGLEIEAEGTRVNLGFPGGLQRRGLMSRGRIRLHGGVDLEMRVVRSIIG